MNKFKKYCANVWVAECEEEYKKGDIITLETKYGKKIECEVYNLVVEKNDLKYYSIVRVKENSYAERKANKYKNAALKSENKSNEALKAADEGRDFLSLGEPIKIGHHSEKRHRALIERNRKRMDKCIEFSNKAEEQANKAKYWEIKAKEITLAMPESLEFYKIELERVEKLRVGLKDGSIKREHSYSLTYATKNAKGLKKKVELAQLLWGGETNGKRN